MGVYDTFKTERGPTTSLYSQFQTERTAESQPQQNVFKTFFSGFRRGVMEEGKPATEKAFGSFGRGVYSLRDAPTEMWKTFFDTGKHAKNQFNYGFRKVLGDFETTGAERVAGGVSLGLGLANAIFSAPMAIFKGAENLPVIGIPAAGFNSVLAGISNGSSDVALQKLNESGLSQETKDTLTPVVSETAGLVGILIAGKGSAKVYSKIQSNTNQMISEVQKEPGRQLQVESKTPETMDVFIDRFRADNELPVIDFGAGKAVDRSGLPTVQVGESAGLDT